MTNELDSKQHTDTLPVIYIDRSRVECAESCMRKRFYQYEINGVGIQKAGNWLDPLIGTAVHNGIEGLLTGKNIEQAVVIVKETILAAQREGPIVVFRQGLDPAKDVEEGMLLAEALVRGWAAVRLQALLATYDVVAIEKECQKDYESGGRKIIQLSRPDIVLRRKDDKSLFIMNLKTTSRVDQKWREQWRYDMQTFSEAAAVEQLLGEPVAGTIICGLVKGSRKDYPMGSGDYHWDSILTQAWTKSGELGQQDEWFGRYEWSCMAAHKLGNGRACPGGKQHRLSGVHKAQITERLGGVSGWISYLAVEDRALLEDQFVELTPILRSAYEIERWKQQKLPMEIAIREHRDYLIDSTNVIQDDEDLLNAWFPMSTAKGNCLWPSQCTFFDVCHGVAGDDLAGAGFVERSPNHPSEGEE